MAGGGRGKWNKVNKQSVGTAPRRLFGLICYDTIVWTAALRVVAHRIMAGLENLIYSIYHERQQPGSMLCAQHALNSLLRMSFLSIA